MAELTRPSMSPDAERARDRRFLLRALFFIGTALAVLIGILACLYSGSLPNSWYRNLTGQQLNPQESTSICRLGVLTDFAAIGVYQNSQGDGCWVVRLPENQLIAINTNCTHDGCATSRVSETAAYGCPCCGSKFQMDGKTLSGPAEQSLERFKIYMDKDSVLVNRSDTFQESAGGWQNAAAFLSLDKQ